MKKPPRITATERLPSALDLLPQEPLLDQYEKTLGALVMRLSLFHFILELHLWSLLGIDTESGRTITGDLPFKSLIHRLKRLAKTKLKQADDLKVHDRILNDLDKIIEQRNHLAHAMWHFPDSGGPPLIIPKKGNLMSKHAPSVMDMQQLVDGAEKLLNEFIFKNFGQEIPGQSPSTHT